MKGARTRMYEFCLRKDAMLKGRYLNGKDIHILWPYNNAFTQDVINRMVILPRGDIALCPWCIAQSITTPGNNPKMFSCNGCIYGEVFGRCYEYDSNYKRLLRGFGECSIYRILTQNEMDELFHILCNTQ